MRMYRYGLYFIGEVTREGSWSELTQLQGIGLAFEPLQLLTPPLCSRGLKASLSLFISFMESCLPSLALCTAFKMAPQV